MDDELVLQECGLTKIESKVYLELLNQEMVTAYVVAKNSGLHKANCYNALNTLVEKGIVSLNNQNNHTYFEANDPITILQFLRRKEELVSALLPRLKLLKNEKKSSDAAIFKGVKTQINLLYELLDYKKDIIVYGIPRLAPQKMAPHLTDFHKERIKRKIKMYHIYNFDAKERINYLNSMPYTYARALPSKVQSNTVRIVCGSQTQLSVWAENKEVKIIRILDMDVADSFRSYFNFLWPLAK